MGQMEMKWIFNIGKKYFYIGQGYSGERCGPWTSSFPVSTKDRPIRSPLTTHKGMLRTYSNLDPHGPPFSCLLQHTCVCWGPILIRIFTGQSKVRHIMHFIWMYLNFICNNVSCNYLNHFVIKGMNVTKINKGTSLQWKYEVHILKQRIEMVHLVWNWPLAITCVQMDF
jgi:hypothetical protein